MNKKPLVLLVVFLLVSSLACNILSPGAIEQAVRDAGEGAAQTAIAMGEGTAQAVAQTAVAGAMTPEAPDSPDATEAPQSGEPPAVSSLDDLSVGIDELQSYRMQFIMQFEGKDTSGQTQNGSIEMLQEVETATGDRHFKMDNTGYTGASTPEGSVEFIQKGGVTYMLTSQAGEDPTCLGITSDATGTFTDVMSAAAFLNNTQDLKLVERGVMVNGVNTDQYHFDATSVQGSQFTSGEGEVWLAQDGGYVVKMNGTGIGQAGFLDLTEGSVDWDYELTSINEPVEVVVPENCTAPAGTSNDIPLPENISDQTSLGNMLTFTTTDTPKSVFDFYTSKLTEQGWQEESKTEMDTLYLVRYTKDGKTLDITISGDGATTSVIILQGP